MLVRQVLCPSGEVKGAVKKERLRNKAEPEGFVGIYQAEVGDGEERELCSSQRVQHVQKSLRGECKVYMGKCETSCILGLGVSD